MDHLSPAADPEREAFAATLLELGPAAPTILPGWDAAELLEHLLVRERGTPLTLGAHLPGPLGRRAAAALRERSERPWGTQVETFRRGPGRLSPIGAVDRFSGMGELFIHHEDLRRARPGWRPRRLPAAEQARAWRATGLFARLALDVDADVTLVSELGGRQLRSRRSRGALRVHGEPLELLLWAGGRDEVAQVRVDGDAAAQRALKEGRRGL